MVGGKTLEYAFFFFFGGGGVNFYLLGEMGGGGLIFHIITRPDAEFSLHSQNLFTGEHAPGPP